MDEMFDEEDEDPRIDRKVERTIALVANLIRSRRPNRLSRLARLLDWMGRTTLCQSTASELITGVERCTSRCSKPVKRIVDPKLQQMRWRWGIGRQEECPCQEELANGNSDAICGDAGATDPPPSKEARIWGDVVIPATDNARHSEQSGPSPLRIHTTQLSRGYLG